jgi:hypothetical protein
LAFDVEKILLAGRWRLYMNIAAFSAALVADQGLSSHEHYCYLTLCFSGGMLPCYIDALKKVEGTFFPLTCDRIQYEGAPHRDWQATIK